jgi:magnesium chelatase family protein
VNAHVPARQLQSEGALTSDARALLTSAAERLGLTARGYHRVLRVARTIADLDVSGSVESPHVAEALRYRTTGAAALGE